MKKLLFLLTFLFICFLELPNVNATTTGNLTVNRIRYYDVSGNMYQTSNYGSMTSGNVINNMYIYFKANSLTGITNKYVILSGFTSMQQLSSSDLDPTFTITPVVLMDGTLDNSNSCFMSKTDLTSSTDQSFTNTGISWVVACKLDHPLHGTNDSNILHFSTISGGGQRSINTYLNDRFYLTDDPFDSKSQEIINSINNSANSITNSIDSVDDTLNSSSVDSSDSSINNLKDKIPTNSVISDLLLLPVRFLQNFVNALGSSCSQFDLGSLYGTNLYMPCINIQNYLGSAIWTTIDLIISGLFVYSLRKKFIQIYENLTNLKNGGNEVD